MTDQIEMWGDEPNYRYGIETPNLEPPEPAEEPDEDDYDYDDGYDDDDDSPDFEMPVDDGDVE